MGRWFLFLVIAGTGISPEPALCVGTKTVDHQVVTLWALDLWGMRASKKTRRFTFPLKTEMVLPYSLTVAAS